MIHVVLIEVALQEFLVNISTTLRCKRFKRKRGNIRLFGAELVQHAGLAVKETMSANIGCRGIT